MGTDVLSTPTLAGLFVAGLSLGAVYAYHYTRLGRPSAEESRGDADGRSGGTRQSGSTGEAEKRAGGTTQGTSGVRKGRRRGNDKDKDKGVGGGESKDGGKDKGRIKGGSGGGGGETAVAGAIPGDFDGASEDVASQEGSTTRTTSKQEASVENPKKRKRAKKQKQKLGKGKGGDENKEAGSETDREVDVRRTAVQGPRSDDSTDASLSLSPSASSHALPGSSHRMTRENLLAQSSQPHAQSREIRPSLSFDTDSSWTHVDRRRLKPSKSTDGQAPTLADAIDMTSSDLASTASDSPVAERMDNVTMEVRGARAHLAQRTLAERLVPRPRKTGVDDMLEQPDFPTLTRVMRVQPRADETPVPGFSWEDYGDVVEDSVLVHDADEEDEGEWGVVKSRHRTRPLQTTSTTATSASTSTSHAPAASETMTKKQRQNARKRELAKATKAEAETARLQGLAKHKRELERLRIIEQSQQGGGKRPSGGMQATVNDQGKLVWE